MQTILEEVAFYTVYLELENNLEKFMGKVVVSGENTEEMMIFKKHIAL